MWPFSLGRLNNGGDHRSTQIQELLAGGGSQPVFIDPSRITKSRLSLVLRTAQRILQFRQIPSRFPRGVSVFGNDFFVCRDQISRLKPIDSMIWEATSECSTMAILRKYARRVVAVPQNLESLGAQRSGIFGRNSAKFSKEIKFLSMADEVFTISEDEAWILRLMGLKASCLPYFPPKVLSDRLLAIRALRQKVEPQNGFLILGSMTNPPTAEALRELVSWLSESAISRSSRFLVAGNGTEVLAHEKHMENVQILGRVSHDELDQLRVHVKGVIIHQRITTGMVTRIAESVLAGIPVIANSDAARGGASFDGVHVYNSITELSDLLNADLPIPNIPSRPSKEETKFQQSICG